MHTETIIIGIDPGTRTGLAVKRLGQQKLHRVDTLKIHEALDEVKRYANTEGVQVYVVVEDARQRKWFAKTAGREKLQGAGSIKRDCAIWEDYLQELGVPYHLRPPAARTTKWSSDFFQAVTGWQGRTSEHARDAAILIWGIEKGTLKTIRWQPKNHNTTTPQHP